MRRENEHLGSEREAAGAPPLPSYRPQIQIWDHSVCVCVCMCVCESLSRVRLFATPWTVACQDPLSMEFSRQEYWSGLPFLSLVAPGKSCLLLGDSGSKAVHSLQPLGEIDAYTDISLLWIR